MAITIITNPNNWQNVYNEIVLNVSGSNSTQPNYQFLCDVNINGQTNPITRLTYPKQPLVGTVNINIADVVRNYVTYDFGSFNVSGLQACTNSKAKYWIELGEIYDNASGVPVVYANQTQYGTSGSPKSGSNAIFDFLDWTKTAFSTGKKISETNPVGLNQTLFTDKIQVGQQRFLNIFDPDRNTTDIEVAVYNATGGALGAVDAAFVPGTEGIYSFNVGDAMLNGYNLTGLTTSPDAAYYTIRLRDAGDNTLLSRTINIDQECSKYQTYRLHWLNSLGGFDSFNFTKISREMDEIERKQFKKFQRLNYATTDRLKTNYFTKLTESVILNSDLLSDAEYSGLEELILSPVVMLEVNSSTYVPVNIRETNYEKKKYINDQAIPNFTITIEYTFENYRQAL